MLLSKLQCWGYCLFPSSSTLSYPGQIQSATQRENLRYHEPACSFKLVVVVLSGFSKCQLLQLSIKWLHQSKHP